MSVTDAPPSRQRPHTAASPCALSAHDSPSMVHSPPDAECCPCHCRNHPQPGRCLLKDSPWIIRKRPGGCLTDAAPVLLQGHVLHYPSTSSGTPRSDNGDVSGVPQVTGNRVVNHRTQVVGCVEGRARLPGFQCFVFGEVTALQQHAGSSSLSSGHLLVETWQHAVLSRQA